MRKLSRAELLELLLAQTRETERVRKRLERAEEELAQRRLKIQQAGNLAQAVLEVNGVMEAAQEAAQQYLDNIAQMEQETRQQCEKMLAEARQEAEQIRSSVPKAAVSESKLIEEIYDLLDEEK